MNKMRKILSLFTVFTLLLLFSISPVLAEDSTGSADGSAEAAQTSEATAADTSSGTVEDTSEASSVTAQDTADTAQETPETTAEPGNSVVETIVPITGSPETAVDNVETAPAVPEESNNAVEEIIVPINGSPAETEAADSGSNVESDTETNAETKPAEDNPVLDVIVPIDGGVETIEPIQPVAENPVYIVSDDVVNVIVPINVSITIDPLELAGKGQIYSDIYQIRNDGDNDVLMTLTDIQITFADDMNFEALAQPFDEKIGSNLKAIYMLLDFGRSDIPSAVITDNQSTRGAITIPLASAQDEAAENSVLQLNFSGSVNYAPVVAWEDNDVRISITYTLEAVPPPPPPAVEAPLTTDAAIETPVAEEATQTPAEEATQTPAEEAAQTPAEGATQTPAEEAAQTPAEEAAQTPAEEAAQTPAEEAAQTPAETAPATDITTPESPAESSDSVDSSVESPSGSDSTAPSAPSDTSSDGSSEPST